MNRQEPVSELDEPLRQAVMQIRSDAFPTASANRLLTIACELDEVQGESDKKRIAAEESIPNASWSSSRVIAVIATAATLLIAYVSWPREVLAWEHVLAAIAEQPWLLEIHEANGEAVAETWYGKDAKIIASKSMTGEAGTILVFMDLENKTMDYYSEKVPHPFAREPGKVFRSAIRRDNRRGIDGAAHRYEAALLGEIRGMLIDSYEIDSQQVALVSRAGSKIIEYRFELRPVKEHHPKQVAIFVDSNTNLPVEKHITLRNGETIIRRLSFRTSGPADIFELGVSDDKEIVDTRPNEAVTKILDTLRIGRTEMDPYSAVVTEGKDREPRPRGSEANLVWKSGTRWRIEQIRKSERHDPIPSTENPSGWWHEYVAGSDTAVRVISDGVSECQYSRSRSNGNVPDPKNPDYLLIESYSERKRPHRDPMDPDAYNDEFLAEFAGYPKLVYDGTFDIDKNPEEGPPDTLLFTMTYTDRIERLWLDPARDHLCLRHEWIRIENGQSFGTVETLAAIQSPSGKWLPSVLKTSVPLNNGGKQVRHKSFFYDFETESDPSLFTIKDL